MATMVPPQKNTEYIFYIGLVSQADTKLLQNNPTLASGDVLVSTDGGSTSNLDTLPAVTPASSDIVKVTVSTDEMNGDNIVIVFSDAAGAEWCDLIINIQTAAQSLDTMDTNIDAIPTTAMRGTDNVVLAGPTKAQMDTAHALLATGANLAVLLQVLTGKWEVTNNQFIMYDSDGTTPLYTFDLTQDGTATEFNPDLREPV